MKGWERAESSARGATYPSLNKNKMLDGGHLDLNCIPYCSDSLKERLRQTMLKQEIVFMGQVFELHRLYKIQTAMSEEFKKSGLDNYNSKVAGVSSIPVKLNNQIKCSMNDLQTRAPGGFKQKPLDLQLSADDFIRQSANEISGKEALRGFPFDLNNSSQDAVAFDLNRSLTIDEDISNRGVGHQSWMGKRISGCPLDNVDVKDTNSSFSKNNVDFRISSDSSISKSYFKDQHRLEKSILINTHNSQSFSRTTNHVYHGTTSTGPFNDVGLTSKRQTLCKTGFNADLLAADTSVSRITMKLDLNTAALEDFSCVSNTTSSVFNPVATSMSAMTHKVNSYAEMPQVHFRNYEGKLSGDRMPQVKASKPIFIDLDPDSGEDICNSGEPKIESVGSTSKLSNDLSCEMEIEKVPKPAMLSHICLNSMVSEKLSGLKLSNSSESKCMIEHQECSIKTMHSGVNGIDSNLTSSNESQMIDLGPERAYSGAPERRSSESRDLKLHCINNKEAADLLVQISLQRQPEYVGSSVKLNTKVPESKEQDQPQCSLESYEAMVLNTKDWGPEDYCVSSNAFLVDEPEMRDSRYKLKRGTRMKDFQKDILSSLSTLSRHEIREDINIFEGVIKSREYKRTRAKVIDEGTWCRSTRSKRSRLGRR